MCGIFGAVIGSERVNIDKRKLIKILSDESQARGRDSAGFMFYDRDSNRYAVLKGSMPIGELSRTAEFSRSAGEDDGIFLFTGHSRLVTNGSQLAGDNNQPVIKDQIIAVHNGIIVNDEELWQKNPHLERSYQIDTEIYLAILRERLAKGLVLGEAVRETNSEMEGTIALALVLTELESLLLFSNNGSLYVLTDEKSALVFASEYYPLKKVADRFGLTEDQGFKISQLSQGSYCNCNYREMKIELGRALLNLKAILPDKETVGHDPLIRVEEVSDGKKELNLVPDVATIAGAAEAKELAKELEYNRALAESITRCSKCLLTTAITTRSGTTRKAWTSWRLLLSLTGARMAVPIV